jgi:predicted O-methyltransferase YrrM
MDNQQIQNYVSKYIETTRHGTGDSDRHVLPLFSLALASKGKVYLELGVRGGTTTLPLLLAAHLNGGVLYSVDINQSIFHCPPELANSWKFIKSDALEFLKNWNTSTQIDFVFIDDWHTYPHVKKELAYLSKYITPSSIILLHDLMYAGYDPRYHTNPAQWKGEWAYGGPYRAVNKLSKRKWEWATLPWHSGLTILRKKAPTYIDPRFRQWVKYYLRKIFSYEFERKVADRYRKYKARKNER